MSGTENVVWNSLQDVARNFLGNTKAPNYIEFVEHMIDSYKNHGLQRVFKIHCLHWHLSFFLQTVVTLVTWVAFSPEYCSYGKTVPKKMEPIDVN